jgi:hypothetical protein
LLVLLLVAAAAAAAAVAHAVIDVVADYAVAHASYDDVGSHGSRGLVVGVAISAASLIALRGLRLCCDVAARRGVHAPDPPSWRIAAPFSLATAMLACAAVPAMEWIDTLLAREPLHDLGDAFGGSVALGVAITVACALLVAIVTFALVRWLLSHRYRIIAAIVAIIRDASAAQLDCARPRAFTVVPVRRRSVSSLRRSKRGPPRTAVSSWLSYMQTVSRGFQCCTCYSACAASS